MKNKLLFGAVAASLFVSVGVFAQDGSSPYFDAAAPPAPHTHAIGDISPAVAADPHVHLPGQVGHPHIASDLPTHSHAFGDLSGVAADPHSHLAADLPPCPTATTAVEGCGTIATQAEVDAGVQATDWITSETHAGFHESGIIVPLTAASPLGGPSVLVGTVTLPRSGRVSLSVEFVWLAPRASNDVWNNLIYSGGAVIRYARPVAGSGLGNGMVESVHVEFDYTAGDAIELFAGMANGGTFTSARNYWTYIGK